MEQIRDLIKEGKLKAGDKLPPEQVLAEKFGTSRPSVREALSALEILGITESRGGKGNFIKNTPRSPLYEQEVMELEEEESPFELLEARKAVEIEIADLAAKKATLEDIDAIGDSLNKMEKVMNDIPQLMELDREFHMNIARAAHNNLLFSMMTYLVDLLKEELWINLKEKSWSIPGRPQKYFEEHTEIFSAIKNKDSKGARKRMYDHLAGVEEIYLMSSNMEGKYARVMDRKEKTKKKYRYQDYITPFEKLRTIPDARIYLKEGITLEMLAEIARRYTDNEMAEKVQLERDKLIKY